MEAERRQINNCLIKYIKKSNIILPSLEKIMIKCSDDRRRRSWRTGRVRGGRASVSTPAISSFMRYHTFFTHLQRNRKKFPCVVLKRCKERTGG
jgi:hypothetical protein